MHWYNRVPEREAMSAILNCPVFKSLEGRQSGNTSAMEPLVPCQLEALYYSQRKDRLIIVNRFASFLDTVPNDD